MASLCFKCNVDRYIFESVLWLSNVVFNELKTSRLIIGRIGAGNIGTALNKIIAKSAQYKVQFVSNKKCHVIFCSGEYLESFTKNHPDVSHLTLYKKTKMIWEEIRPNILI